MDEAVWGKIETKLRRLVFDLIEPTITRVTDHKDALENLRRTDEAIVKKIDHLEIQTEKLSKKLSLIDDFSKKIMQFDATIKIQETTFAHDRESMKDELEMFLKRLTNSDENIAMLQGQTQSLRSDLVNLAFDTNNSKQILTNRIEVVRDELITHTDSLTNKTGELNNYYAILEKKISNFMHEFDELDVIAKKAEHSGEDNMNQLKLIFKNFAQFKKESISNLEKVRHMAMQFSQTVTDQMKVLKDKFKNESPILIQLLISENLHSVLELKNKKLLADFETCKYAEWELMSSTTQFDDMIELAKRKTQEAIDTPLPREPTPRIQAPSPVPESPTLRIRKEKSPRRKHKNKDIENIEEVSIVEISNKLDDENNLQDEKNIIKPEPVEVVKETIEIIPLPNLLQTNQGINIVAPINEEKVNVIEKEQVNEKETEKVIDKKDKKKKKESSSSEVEEGKKRKPIPPRTPVYQGPPIVEFNLDTIKKYRKEIIEILNVQDFGEDIDIIHQNLKKIREEVAAHVKKLQNTSMSIEEKVQLILKKQYETNQKVEEQKNISIDISNRINTNREEFITTNFAVHEKIAKESIDLNKRIQELVNDFSFLAKETKKRIDMVFDNFKVLEGEIHRLMKEHDDLLKSFYDTFIKKSEILELQIQQAAYECNAAVTQRKRDHSDNQGEFKRIHGIFEMLNKRNDQISKNIDSVNKSLQLLIEFSRITNALLLQDEIDRETIALFGVKESKHNSNKSVNVSKPSVTIDTKCLTCSGQPNFITSAFKLACLAYAPTSVMFKDIIYERSELIDIQKRIVDGISDDTLMDFPGFNETAKHSISVKTGQWRPSSRLSNLSISQAIGTTTPDLPPLSFPKRNNF
ncbi:hypothetical protein SteCoe_26977 [Stentor coeruleus]|uniref:Uncharacterized protein n=1 Tax=Stentor coeruleus TaxID=5963 RepID=A0A1R2BBK1_9CILI|nr:hypothetical protein SteCoe_26977 [Stentor coeruleus]